MFRTGALLFFAGQFLFIKSQYSQHHYEEQIQDDIFKIISKQTQDSWSETPSDQNIAFSPISSKVEIQMKKWSKGIRKIPCTGGTHNKNELSSALARILDKLTQTSNAQVQFMNVILYDQHFTRKQFVDDLKQHYHADAYAISFFSVGSNEAILALVNEWESRVTNGRSPTIENYPTEGLANILDSKLSFKSCWDTPKTSANSIKELKFKTPNGEIDIEAINAKETIGYYNNAEQKYEAIRLPYNQGEFAMIIVLPNQDQSLESIRKFTKNDHKQILQRVGENHENIDYVIPFIKLREMSVNQNGTSIHADDKNLCYWGSAQETREVNKIDYKPFHVNRPFAVYIYHEKTKFVFMYALVNNPRIRNKGISYICGKISVTTFDDEKKME